MTAPIPPLRPDADDLLVVCDTPGCAHIEGFHAEDAKADPGHRPCLALDCGCKEWRPKQVERAAAAEI